MYLKIRSRENSLDVAKGIGMLAVIVAHTSVSKLLYNSLYTFHLPLFFIISGYFFHFDERFSYFLLKKVKGYLIPYVFFALIITLFDTAGGIAKGKWYRIFIMDAEKFIVQIRYSTLWFLAVLFLAVLIFWIIHWLCKSDLKKVMIVGIGIGIVFILYDTYIKVSLPWNLDTAFIIQIYLSVGYCIKKTEFLERLKKHTWINCAALGLISTGCSIMNCWICRHPYEMYYNSYGIFPLTVSAAITGSLAVILLSSKLTAVKPLAWLGRNTMVFFALHQSVAMPIAVFILNRFVNSKMLNLPMHILYLFLELSVILLICTAIYEGIMKLHMGRVIGKEDTNKVNI